MAKSKESEWVWYQEYKNCSCTEIQFTRKALLGYCRRHMNPPRRTVKLPRGPFNDLDIGCCET